MTTIGYCTTEADGRINDQMMWMHEGIREKLSHMNRELKQLAHGVKISGQMRDAKRVRDRVDCQMVYIGDCTDVTSIETVIREGFDFIQLGRTLIKDPNFVKNAMADRDYQNGCIHCNRCASLIEAPGGSYGPLNGAAKTA